MSTLQVANIHLETTGNNRFQYTGSNNASVTIANNMSFTVTSNVSFTTNNVSFTVQNTFVAIAGSTNAYVISATANVGFGNAAPATKLQIGGNYGVVATTLSAGNNHNVNCALGNYFIIPCNSSSQNVYFTSAPANTVYSMTLRFSNGGGGNTISWANTPKWPSATAPTPSTNNDIWVFITDDGGTTWRGNQVQKDSR